MSARKTSPFLIAAAVFGASAAAHAQTMRWDEGWQPHTTTLQSGSTFLTADAVGTVRTGSTDGFGAWETFVVFNTSRADRAPRLGDIVIVRAHTGGFLSRLSTGVANARNPDDMGYYQLGPSSGLFRVGDPLPSTGVKLRVVSPPNPYAPAVADGTWMSLDGRAALGLNASGNMISSASGTALQLAFHAPELVRVMGLNSRWMAAENGGGGAVTVNRTEPAQWEGFVLHNLNRPGAALQSGDVVALETFNTKRLALPGSSASAANGTQLVATSNRTDSTTRMLITQFFPAADGTRWVQLRPQRFASGGLALEGDRVVYRSAPSGSASLWFLLVPTDAEPARYLWLSGGSGLPSSRPFATLPTPITGSRKVAALLRDLPGSPFAFTPAQVQAGLMGDASGQFSVKSYVDANTGGAIQLSFGGAFGPFPVSASATPSGILSAAATAGIDLRPLANSKGQISHEEVLFYNLASDAFGGQAQSGISAVGWNGVSFCCEWIVAGVVNAAWTGLVAHEASHNLWDQADNYGFATSLRGDVAAWPTPRSGPTAWGPLGAAEGPVPANSQLVIERVSGAGALLNGDSVRLRAADGTYLTVAPEQLLFSDAPPFPSVLNRGSTSASSGTIFTLDRVSGATGSSVPSGDRVRLIVGADRVNDPRLGVPFGTYNGVISRRPADWATASWTHFRLDLHPSDASVSGARVALVSDAGAGTLVIADVNQRTPAGRRDRRDLRRGYWWSGQQSRGGGGVYDNADLHGKNLVSTYHRMKNGWAQIRFVTPDQRGCYELDPFLDSRQTIVLFDPQNAAEWYTLELREQRAELDEVPSGFVVSWMSTDGAYWSDWFTRRNDEDVALQGSIVPVVVSAAVPGMPPNALARPLSLAPNDHRNYQQAAFTNEGHVALPLGSGFPSRFELSFSYAGGGGSVCVH